MYMRRTVHWAVLALAVAIPATAQTAIDVVTVEGKTVRGPLGEPPGSTVGADDHGTATTFEGAQLRDVLAKAGIPLGDRLRGPSALAQIVLAPATDGYQGGVA